MMNTCIQRKKKQDEIKTRHLEETIHFGGTHRVLDWKFDKLLYWMNKKFIIDVNEILLMINIIALSLN